MNYPVADIISRARSAADMTDDFVSVAEWVAFLNAEKRALDTKIAFAGHIFQERESAIVAQGLPSYGFSEVRAILAVYQVENGRYRRLKHADQFDGNVRDRGLTNGDRATSFRCQTAENGDVEISLYPNPTTGDYRVIMLLEQALLASDSEVVYPMGWEERIVLGMARRALGKEETINPAIEARINEIDQEIERSAWDRAMAGARVRNVDRVERGWIEYPIIPSREYWYFV